jgi:hypothetical protein
MPIWSGRTAAIVGAFGARRSRARRSFGRHPRRDDTRLAATDGRDLGPQFDVLLGAWNALLIEADPGTGQVALRWVDDAGAVLIERTVTL